MSATPSAVGYPSAPVTGPSLVYAYVPAPSALSAPSAPSTVTSMRSCSSACSHRFQGFGTREPSSARRSVNLPRGSPAETCTAA